MRWTTQAISRLRQDLTAVQDHAATLPWASRSPWAVQSHIRTERRLHIRRERDQRIVKLDLHGLDGVGARMACELLREGLLDPSHPLRYARVVVGRGKRSTDGRRVLAGIAAEVLRAEDPLATRSSTVNAPRGFLDVWHRGRWPRHRLRP